MAKKQTTTDGKKAPTVKKSPPKHSIEQRAAINACARMSKKEYDNSDHAKVMKYEDARDTFSTIPQSPPPQEDKSTSVGIDTDSTLKNLFLAELEKVKNLNDFNKVFTKAFGESTLMHKGMNCVIYPQKVRKSKIDPTQMALEYKMGDTTGGVQLKKFFHYLSVIK